MIAAIIGVALLVVFCVWAVHFPPDMTQFINKSQKAFGILTLCGGPIFLLVAVFLLAIGM